MLGFADGERYVGQSIDVVKRFAQHRLTMATSVPSPVGEYPGRTSRLERECIYSLEALGMRLRNLNHMRVLQGERDLELIITPDEQSQWLARQSAPEDRGRKVDDPGLRRRYLRRFEQFMQSSHAEGALFLLGTHLHAVIPFPSPDRTIFLVDFLLAEQRSWRHLFARQPEYAGGADA